ncbi:UNVERIFIED_CONTAM: hypothetical protein Slati_3082800, partial [Sesamum latifolium]
VNVASVTIFKRDLDEFAKLSGLHANPRRVNLFSLVQSMGLGGPCLSRIKGWEGIQLSFAGRIQLIKLVLMSLNVYWAMAFILPKGVIREVEKCLRSFLWKGTSNVGYRKVAWHLVCRPIEEGSQGIRDILALNKHL